MNKYAKLFKQIFLFGIVGVGSFVIDLGVTTLLYDYVHLTAYIAAGLGFMSAFFFNFPLNRRKVFKHSKDDKFSMQSQIVLYLSLSLLNLIVTSTLIQLIVGAGLMSIGIAKFFLTILIAAWNFVIFKLFIFSKRPNQNEFESLIIQ